MIIWYYTSPCPFPTTYLRPSNPHRLIHHYVCKFHIHEPYLDSILRYRHLHPHELTFHSHEPSPASNNLHKYYPLSTSKSLFLPFSHFSTDPYIDSRFLIALFINLLHLILQTHLYNIQIILILDTFVM